LVDEPVLSGKSLDVLCQLSDLLSFELSKLSLLVELLTQVLAVVSQSLDLLFSLKQLSLIVLILASHDTHLVLHVAEVKALLLKLLLESDKLLSLGIEFTLELVHVRVKHRDRLLQIVVLLLLGQDILLISLNVIEQDSLFSLATLFGAHRVLKALQ